MKIFHLIGTNGPGGGVNSFVLDLTSQQVKRKNDVTVFSLMNDKNTKETISHKFKSNGVKDFSFAKRSLFGALFTIFKFRKILKLASKNERIILNMHLKISELIGIASSIGLKNVVKVITFHSFYRNYKLQNFIQEHFVDSYIAVSEESKEDLINNFHIKKDKVFRVYNGVDEEKIPKKTNVKNTSSLLYFLSAGRFTDQKNFTLSIKAFINSEVNAKYNIYGDGILKDELNLLCSNSNNINICNPLERENLFYEMNSSDVIIMSSKHEGNSIFLIESIFLNKPLILSDINSFREVFNEKPLKKEESFRICEWGFLVKENIIAFSSAIKYIEKNRNILKKMSKKLEYISKEFSINKTEKEYNKVYENLLNKKKGYDIRLT